MPSSRHPRRLQALAVVGAMLALAFSPAIQDVLARDANAQAGLSTQDRAGVQALAAAAMAQAPVACTGGVAAGFPCENVNLEAIVPIVTIGAELGSDIWGWYDEVTEREIAIVTTYVGMAFVDVTTPDVPVTLGRVVLGAYNSGFYWRDVKVYDNHAYLVAEEGGSGLQIFDLTRLRDITTDQGILEVDATYDGFSSAHNIVINEDTATAYVVGGDGGTDCGSGLHMLDISTPLEPVFAGCFDGDGYVHDTECVVYTGPDTRFTDHEICFASNEDTITIVDVTDHANAILLSKTTYDTFAYTHQGSLTPDMEWFIFGDEGDEMGGTVDGTTTYIMDVTDLTAPGTPIAHVQETASIDHNLYLEDGYVWETNYMEGLVVLDYDVATLGDGVLTRAGNFDVLPGLDVAEFAGGWSSYVHFPSRTIVLSSSEVGMFVLEPTMPVQEEAPAPAPAPTASPEPAPAPTSTPAPAAEPEPTNSPLPATGGGLALAGLVAMAVAARRR